MPTFSVLIINFQTLLSTFLISFHCKDPQDCIGLISFFSPDNFSFSLLISVFCPVNSISLLDVLRLAYSDKHIDKEPFTMHFTLESCVNHWLSFGYRGLLLTSTDYIPFYCGLLPGGNDVSLSLRAEGSPC